LERNIDMGLASSRSASWFSRGVRIRLHGADAPESKQLCANASGAEYRCGQQAALALADRIGVQNIAREVLDMDRYGRSVARCWLADLDLNGWLVSQGWALAYREYSADYIAQEKAARAGQVGIWQGAFDPPWDLRKHRGAAAAQPSPGASTGCTIKGNITKEGERIYHVPSQQHYQRTTITVGAGERWFCSEEDARRAGWRGAKR
jgi:endonuclease YncB( thermonuclease family)